MVTKVLSIGIASPEDMRQRTMAVARGELKPQPGDPKVWFPSTESFARVLTQGNRALLETIASTRPESMRELAERTGRAPSNLSRTLRTMERYGLVRLVRGKKGTLRPDVPYESIRLTLPLRRSPEGL